MTYVSEYYHVSIPAINQFLEEVDDDNYVPGWEVLLKIDYAYHHDNDHYDGGLSFINRIYEKLRYRHPQWSAIAFRHRIIQADDPEYEYLSVISEMLADEQDRIIYGI
jgi:hypothetical protein